MLRKLALFALQSSTTVTTGRLLVIPTERKSPGMPGRIYSDILNRIIDGEYKEGDRLPTEHALAERFATSRPTVREALAQLRADGIIATRHGSGTTVVRRPDPNVKRFAPLESLSDIKRCYEYRVVTESGAAALAAEKADDDDIAAIQHEWDNLQTVVETEGIGAKDDFAFHLAIARASKNQFFISAISFIQEQIVFSMNLSRNLSLVKSVERQRLVQQEHLAVLEAIRKRDPQAAALAMRQHLERAVERMFGS
ncbi:FadR family transcriptional regulator [Trinickia violacea]|uniref:FadR family transcriptional regulator n=2 Tax=Trinickia violacea TaxID=2571746 RepID=A0A4P8J5J3_9BURK|nr:FadR family transcriptional regulator [Trinickia violacea]